MNPLTNQTKIYNSLNFDQKNDVKVDDKENINNNENINDNYDFFGKLIKRVKFFENMLRSEKKDGPTISLSKLNANNQQSATLSIETHIPEVKKEMARKKDADGNILKYIRKPNKTLKTSVNRHLLLKKTHAQRFNISNVNHPQRPLLTRKNALREIGITLKPKCECSESLLNELSSELNKQIESTKEFDTSSFLSGLKGPQTDHNNKILNESVKNLKNLANKLVEEKKIVCKEGENPLEIAYQTLIGVVDKIDYKHESYKSFKQKGEEASFTPHTSSFAIRSAILLASKEDGAEIESWMAYTKNDYLQKVSGKINAADMWDFLDNWRNWVPEAQAQLAKFSEIALVKAISLAEHEAVKRGDEEEVILLKGGFGAGKTRLAGELFKEKAEGVIAPDVGKQAILKTMSLSHNAAHIQGSQIAYKLFYDLIKLVAGSAVYDTALSSPGDLEDYLNKSKKAEKKVVVYDVLRNDMARVLAVLARSVGGKDPRTPADIIINSAMRDKLKRVECMNLILSEKVSYSESGQKENKKLPEYHVYASNRQGWDSEEVLVITPAGMKSMHPEMKERLAVENIEVDLEKNTLKLTTSKEKMEAEFIENFEKTPREIMKELSPQENEKFNNIFGQRILLSKPSKIHNEEELYQALPDKVKDAISASYLKKAFQAIKPTTREAFFASLEGKENLSYLDLPLKTALIINQYLSQDLEDRTK